ncbi:MAG TPA: alpha/beta fold hydrolase [Labilithrix sp.]
MLAQATQRTTWTVVDGVAMHWVEHGRGRPLVLLHGLGDSHTAWKSVAPALAAGRRVLMPDLPGHGRSSRPNASYELAWHSRIVSRWATAIGLEEIDVVAHSFGGGVAQMMLLEPAPRIRRLVLVAPGGLGPEVNVPLRLASLPFVVETIGQPFMKLGTKLALGFRDDDVRELARMNASRGTARAFARTIRGVIDLRGQHRSFYQRGHEIPSLPPIRVLWGEDDPIIPPQHGDRFARTVEGVTVRRFPGCGHYVHRENPHRFVREVRDFLDSHHEPPARYVNGSTEARTSTT